MRLHKHVLKINPPNITKKVETSFTLNWIPTTNNYKEINNNHYRKIIFCNKFLIWKHCIYIQFANWYPSKTNCSSIGGGGLHSFRSVIGHKGRKLLVSHCHGHDHHQSPEEYLKWTWKKKQKCTLLSLQVWWFFCFHTFLLSFLQACTSFLPLESQQTDDAQQLVIWRAMTAQQVETMHEYVTSWKRLLHVQLLL